MIERSRAFLLVALGEAIVTTGAGLAHARATLAAVVSGVLALTVVAALWATYFAGSDRLVQERAEQTGNPLGLARLAVNSQLVNLAALIAIAVASEISVTRPDQRAGTSVVLLLFGGVGLFLAVQTWYRFRLSGRVSWSRISAQICLAGVAGVAVFLPAVLALLLAVLVLGMLCLTILHERGVSSPLMP